MSGDIPIWVEDSDDKADWIKTLRWDFPFVEPSDAELFIQAVGDVVALQLASNELPAGTVMPAELRRRVQELLAR